MADYFEIWATMGTKFKMEVGKMYDVAFGRGHYDIDYENGVRCIKITPKSYRIEGKDGTTTLVGKDSIFDLKEISDTQKEK